MAAEGHEVVEVGEMGGMVGEPGEDVLVGLLDGLGDGLELVGWGAVVGCLEEGGDGFEEGSAGVEAGWYGVRWCCDWEVGRRGMY